MTGGHTGKVIGSPFEVFNIDLSSNFGSHVIGSKPFERPRRSSVPVGGSYRHNVGSGRGVTEESEMLIVVLDQGRPCGK